MGIAITKITSSLAQVLSDVQFRDFGVARIAVVSLEDTTLVFAGVLNTWYQVPKQFVQKVLENSEIHEKRS